MRTLAGGPELINRGVIQVAGDGRRAGAHHTLAGVAEIVGLARDPALEHMAAGDGGHGGSADVGVAPSGHALGGGAGAGVEGHREGGGAHAVAAKVAEAVLVVVLVGVSGRAAGAAPIGSVIVTQGRGGFLPIPFAANPALICNVSACCAGGLCDGTGGLGRMLHHIAPGRAAGGLAGMPMAGRVLGPLGIVVVTRHRNGYRDRLRAVFAFERSAAFLVASCVFGFLIL